LEKGDFEDVCGRDYLEEVTERFNAYNTEVDRLVDELDSL
jgi:hypothetical protein